MFCFFKCTVPKNCACDMFSACITPGRGKKYSWKPPLELSMKMKKCITKNRGYTTLCSIGRALSGENFSLADSELNPGDIACFQYAPIVSGEVERSFSIYNSVLADNRQSFCLKHFIRMWEWYRIKIHKKSRIFLRLKYFLHS